MSSFEFEIAIQRKFGKSWPVVVRVKQPDGLTTHTEGSLQLSEDGLIQLRQEQENYLKYGTLLGKALFGENIREIFIRTLAKSSQEHKVRILLANEADKEDEIQTLHWERLCAPIDAGGEWNLLARDQRVPFSLYIPTIIDRRFPPIGRRDLRALVIVASPSNLSKYNLAEFDVENTANGVRTALGEIPCDVLANNIDGAMGEPSLEQLSLQLTNAKQPYTLLHIVSHGMLGKDGETALFWATKDNQVQRVTGTQLIQELKYIGEKQGLPHLSFLCTCESADPRAAGALGGLGQRLVRDLGMPAVVAMTRKVTIETALNLGQKFYQRLQESGEVDLALKEATAGLGDRDDITVPALFSRLGGRPLFSDRLEGRELTNGEIEFGIEKLRKLIAQRAPSAEVLQQSFNKQVQTLKNTQGSELPAARQQRRQAIDELNILCSQVLEISFDALAALDKQPPEYYLECPFPGLSSFREQKYHKFFFGREQLVAELQQALSKDNFLAVLGASGSGKSSVVLAGLIPKLQGQQLNLQMAYLTPTNDPVAELKASLSKVSNQAVVLVVDQFEELFTLCSDEDKRRQFIEQVLQLAQTQKVIITIRADFMGECSSYKDLCQRMEQNLKMIAPMNAAELGKAMKMQADQAYLEFEEGLNNAILAEVEKEPGAMPLLQYALQLLWNRRWGRWLCYEEYEDIGGVQKAISQTADAVYDSLSVPEQEQVKNIFIRLTNFNPQSVGKEQQKSTRRRVPFDELVSVEDDPTVIKKLLERLAGEGARLVVTSQDEVTDTQEVEVTHEALIRHWSRLQTWLEEDSSNLQLREEIRQEAIKWKNYNKDEYLVHREGRLEDAKALLKQHRFLNRIEEDYVRACVNYQQRLDKQREADKEKELEQEKKARKTAQRVTIGTAIAGAILAGLGIFAQIQQWQAKINEIKAWQLSAEALLASGQELDALICILQTRKKLQDLPFLPNSTLGNEVEVTLHKVVSGIREINRLEGHTLDNKGARGVNSVAFSPDGKQLASGGVDGNVILWDKSGQKLKKKFVGSKENTDWVMSLSFSPDGKILASATDSKTDNFQLWDLENQQQLRNFQGKKIQLQPVWFYSMGFSPAGDGKQYIATGEEDGTVRLWDLLGNLLQEFSIEPKDIKGVKSNSFSPDGKMVASASSAKTKDTKRVRSITFSPDGKMLASVGDDGFVRLWDVDKPKQPKYFFNAGQRELYGIKFTPDGQQIATGAANGSIGFWNVSPTTQKNQLDSGKQIVGGHVGRVLTLSFSPDGKLLASAGKDGIVRLWNGETQQQFTDFTAHTGEVRSVSFSPNPNDKLLASASQDGTVRLWNLKWQKPFWDIKETNKALMTLWSVSVNQNHSLLAIAGNDGNVRLWKLDNLIKSDQPQQPFKTFKVGIGGLFSISFSPQDENLLAIAGYKGICLWKVTENQATSCKTEKQIEFKSVSFSSDGKQIATTGKDEKVKLWKLDGDKLQFQAALVNSLQKGYEGLAVSFSPDGKHLAVAGYDRTVTLWALDLSNNNQPQNLQGHDGWVNSVDFSPNGEYLATASNDGTVILWDFKGKKLSQWKAHSQAVRNLKFDPDGKLLATTGDDQMVRLWDLQAGLKHFQPSKFSQTTLKQKTVKDGPLLREFKGHTNGVLSVAFINKNHKKLLVTTARDGTGRLWEIESTNELMVKGCNWVRDYLKNPTAKLSDEERKICDGIGTSSKLRN